MANKVGRPPTAKTVKDYFSSGSGRKLWKEGQAEKDNVGNGLGEFDDGKYRVKLVKAFTAMSNSSGRPQNVFGFKFVDGEYKGQTIFQYQGLDNKVGIAIALQNLAKLGQPVDSPDEIDDADKKLQKSQPEAEIRLRTRGEYQNVIISSVVKDSSDELDEEEDEDADVEEEDEDDAVESSADEDDDEDGKDKDSDDTDEDDEEADEESDDEDEDDEDSDDDSEEDEEKPSKKSKEKKSEKKKPAPEKDEDDEDEDSDDEDEDEEEEADEVALEPGMKLKVKHDGETVKAKIVKVNEKAREVKVKLADGSKVTLSVDEIVDVL